MANDLTYLAGLRPHNNVAFPVADATVLEVGDHVKIVAGLIVLAPVAADDANLIGLMVDAKPANVPAQNGKVTVSLADGVSRYKKQLDAPATILPGATVEIAGNQTLTPGVTDPVAMVVEGGTSVSEVIVIYKRSPLL